MTARVDLDVLFEPVEAIDAWLEDLLAGAPLLVALLLAVLLGLRHASDPDHLIAVTALAASDGLSARRGATLGAWWGIGHAATLVLLGIPLIAFGGALPAWLPAAAERLVGVVIVALAVRVLWRWVRRRPPVGGRGAPARRHVLRTSWRSFGIGALHGLAGTGAVVLLLLAAIDDALVAAAALAVFAPMSVLSMTALSAGFGWLFTRPVVSRAYAAVVVPVLGRSRSCSGCGTRGSRRGRRAIGLADVRQLVG